MIHKLEEWLNENAYSAVDNYMFAFYNPPFTTPMLYNVHACQDTKLNFLVMNSFREFYAAA